MIDISPAAMGPAKKTGIYFHASAVNVSGKALLFLGHSTAGKSTISRLLSERYPIIADDKVRAWQKKNGDWMIDDGSADWQTGKENVISAGPKTGYPLLAVMRIFKSKDVRLKPLSSRKTCRYLMDAVFEVDGQRGNTNLKAVKKWFSYTAEISRTYTGWSLTFKKDKSIIEFVHDKFK